MNKGTRVTSMFSVTLAVLCLGLAACSSPEPSQAQTPAPAAAAQTAQRYDLKGKVVAVDKIGKKLTVDHEAIPGFMGAMTMPYPVKDEHLLDNLSPGDQVTAKVVSSGGEIWLENIAAVNAAAPAK
jgi:protein SCO1